MTMSVKKNKLQIGKIVASLLLASCCAVAIASGRGGAPYMPIGEERLLPNLAPHLVPPAVIHDAEEPAQLPAPAPMPIAEPNQEIDWDRLEEEAVLYRPQPGTTIFEVADAIRQAQHPLRIYLGHNNIGTEGARVIADAIRYAQHPLEIAIGDNNIGAEGARAIADAIRYAQHPMTIGIMGNNIGDAGARDIADAIKQAQYPMRIDLGRNNIGDEGTRIIADAIRYAQHPMTIGIMGNNIGDAGAQAIADALIQAQHPMIIDLPLNNISANATKMLAKVLADRFFMPHRITLGYEHNLQLKKHKKQKFTELVYIMKWLFPNKDLNHDNLREILKHAVTYGDTRYELKHMLSFFESMKKVLDKRATVQEQASYGSISTYLIDHMYVLYNYFIHKFGW